MKHLTRLLRSGAITPQTYAEGLSALQDEIQGLPTPTPLWRRPIPTRRERPTPAPRGHPTAEMDAYIEEILSQMPDERPIPAPRWRRPIRAPRQLVFRRTRWVIGSFLRGWQMDVPQGHPHGADPRAFLEEVRLQIWAKLEEEIKNGIKFQLAPKVQLRKDNPDGSEEYTDPVLRHKQEAILQNSEIEGALNQTFRTIQVTLEKWTQRGSGWVVDRVEVLWLDIARYQPLRGGSYIPLPAAMRLKKAVVNVKNKADHCLRWALRSALFPARDHVDRPSKYPTDDGLSFEGIDAPTPISQIKRVERQNNLTINVFGWDKGVIVHHISKQPEDMPRVNLLLIEKAGKFLYTWVKDLNRLLHDQSKCSNRKHYCERCLHGYTREDLLEAHARVSWDRPDSSTGGDAGRR